jgi:CRISPR-associated protein Cmr3
MLFSTTGLEFSAQDASGHWEYSLLSEFRIPEHAPTLPAFPQVHPFGGERRASVWKTSALHLPGCPTSLADPAAARRYRLVLLTPAAFEHGWLPGWLVSGSGCPPGLADIQLKLISAAVPRPVPISGWDLNLRAEKATRLLAPAGSVYVVESSQDLSPLWLQSISDRQQDRNDGFGIVAIGAAYDEES